MSRRHWGKHWRSAIKSAEAMDRAIGSRGDDAAPVPLFAGVDAPLAPTKRRRQALTLTPNIQSEHALQIDCTAMLHRIILPPPQVLWWAIDGAGSMDMTIGRNGVPIGILEARNRKLRGMVKGIPDYQFFGWRTAYFIELKRDADAPLTDDQKRVIGDLIKGGYECAICWAKWQVFDRVKQWGLCRPCEVTA
jgi:hypothetical protein